MPLKKQQTTNISSFSLFSKFWGTGLRALITIGITVTFMFHNFFLFSSPDFHLLLLSLWSWHKLQNPLVVTSFSTHSLTLNLFFSSGFDDPFVSKRRILWVSFSWIRFWFKYASTVCLLGHILILCKIPSGSLFQPNHVYSFVLIRCIQLWWELI